MSGGGIWFSQRVVRRGSYSSEVLEAHPGDRDTYRESSSRTRRLGVLRPEVFLIRLLVDVVAGEQIVLDPHNLSNNDVYQSRSSTGEVVQLTLLSARKTAVLVSLSRSGWVRTAFTTMSSTYPKRMAQWMYSTRRGAFFSLEVCYVQLLFSDRLNSTSKGAVEAAVAKLTYGRTQLVRYASTRPCRGTPSSGSCRSPSSPA